MMASLGKPPELRLSGMMVNGKAYLYQPGREMEFGNEAHDFEFNWAVTDFRNPLDNHYYYRLQGVDTGWRDAGKKGSVDFRNLAPDSYRLLLKGVNANGIAAANLLDIRFRILPPFWSTLWFAALVLLALTAIFYALYRFRLRQLLKIERLRNKISLDLHDDIGSTLSSIAILSDMGAQQRGGPQEAELFRDISEQSSYLMDRMDDIVWSINPKNDSSASLFSRLQSFASRLLEARDIRYVFEVDDAARSLRLPMELRQHIFLIMKEAVNNLVKYSGCTQADISVHYEAPWLRVLISDNGDGFDAQQAFAGNGILSMKKRAAAIDAIFEISSGRGQGTQIRLAVKII
jgi:signal transduction histidine kinase